MPMLFRSLLVFSFLVLLSACNAPKTAPISITDAYIRAPIPGQNNSAAFLKVSNNSKATMQLSSVSTTIASNAEIHEHQHDNGTMRMRQLHTLTIEPGQTKIFAPGGLHIMLFNVKSELGQSADINLHFSDGSSVIVNAAIRSIQ